MKNSLHKTHAERIAAIEKVFLEQSAKAISQNKIRGVATMQVICDLAQVDKTHLYGHTPCSEDEAIGYASLLGRIQKFNEDFVKRKNETVRQGLTTEDQLKEAREENHTLAAEITKLEANYELLLQRNNTLLAKNTQLQALANSDLTHEEKIKPLLDVTINIICPDDHLERDGRYRFNNEKKRNEAWANAKKEFIKLMKRNVPQRVYLLVGPPCSGKSSWAKSKNINPDRHAVIVDTTNLTAGERASWAILTAKANDVKICVVRFVVDEMTLRSRNMKRHHKMLDEDVLEEKIKRLEEVDPEVEVVDEMLFVRSDDE